MKRVGVISDTHGSLPRCAYTELADCDYIIHAGDICSPRIYEELKTIASPIAVLGNNDIAEYGGSVQCYAQAYIEGFSFLVAHYKEDVISYLRNLKSQGKDLPQICINGHTHIPIIRQGSHEFSDQLFICPGSTTRPRGGSKPCVIKMEIEQGIYIKPPYFVWLDWF